MGRRPTVHGSRSQGPGFELEAETNAGVGSELAPSGGVGAIGSIRLRSTYSWVSVERLVLTAQDQQAWSLGCLPLQA